MKTFRLLMVVLSEDSTARKLHRLLGRVMLRVRTRITVMEISVKQTAGMVFKWLNSRCAMIMILMN